MSRTRVQGVLLEFPDVRRLWTSQVLSELGDWAARIALGVLVFDRTGSEALTALVTAASLLPWLGAGQALAPLGDRFPRRSVMIASDLIRAGLFASMMVIDSIPLILVAAFLAGLATPPFETARSALLPDLVPKERYGDAVRIAQVTAQAALIGGYVAGGGLTALIGARAALGVNALTFGLSALVLVRLQGGRVPQTIEKPFKVLKDAASSIYRDTLLRRAVLLATLPVSLGIVGEGLVAPFARQQMLESEWFIGALAAAVPIGTVLAALIVPRSGDHRRMLRAAATLGFAGSVAGAVGFIAAPGLPWAFAPFLAIGTMFALMIPANVVGGARIATGVRASSFGLIHGLIAGGQGLAIILGGALAQWLGAAAASGIALIPAAAFCLYAIVTVPDMRRNPEKVRPGEERRSALLAGA